MTSVVTFQPTNSRQYWEKIDPLIKEPRCFMAVTLSQLPDDFKFWDITDSKGYTVAYRHANYMRHCNKSFDKMLDKDFWLTRVGSLTHEWTVAHQMAEEGVVLPSELSREVWCQMGNGLTVAHVYSKTNTLPIPVGSLIWGNYDAGGTVSVAHMAAMNGTLPAASPRWGDEVWSKNIARGGDTIAHIAAMHLRLPDDFNQWGITTRDGWTVAHAYARQLGAVLITMTRKGLEEGQPHIFIDRLNKIPPELLKQRDHAANSACSLTPVETFWRAAHGVR